MLGKIWRGMTKPVFNVRVVRVAKYGIAADVIAGQTTRICTIIVSLHSDRKLGKHQIELQFPRPFIGEVPGVEVSCDPIQHGREEMQIDVFVRVTTIGTYSITPEFPLKEYNFNSILCSPVEFHVNPSEVTSLKLIGIDPVPGHGISGSIYRGGKANILVIAKDDFENVSFEGGWNIEIFTESSFVTLLSTGCDTVKGCQIVTVQCHKAGNISFNLILSQQVVQVKDFKIITPPLSASNSHIIQSNIDTLEKRTYEAGKAITLKLKLIDVFGNPTSFEESKNFLEGFSIASLDKVKSTSRMKRKKEISIKICPSDLDANVCDLEFTPFIAGKRCFSLKEAGKEVRNSPFHITVKPGPLEEIQIVSQEPPALRAYRSRTAKISVILKDVFGNRHTGSNVNFKIVPDNYFVTFLSTTLDSKKETYNVTLRCDKAGKTTFNLIASRNFSQAVKRISMKIIPPPLSISNSYMKQSDIDTMQRRIYEVGQVISFTLKLIDIFGNAKFFEESVESLKSVYFHYLYDGCPSWSNKNESLMTETESLRVCPSDFDPNACVLEFTPSKAGKKWYILKIAGQEINNSKIKIAILPSEEVKADQIHKETPGVHQTSMDENVSVPYRLSDYLEFYEDDQKILCMGVARRQLVGPDQANIKNLNRVLEKEYHENCKVDNDIVSRNYGSLVVFDLGDFPNAAALTVFEVLSLLAKSEHNRNQANEFGNERGKWEAKEKEASFDEDYSEMKRCETLKQECGRLMNENNKEASNAIFEFYNYGRPQSEIDLHGQRVGNPDSINALRQQLLKENNTAQRIDAIIEQQNEKRDEAIRKLKERLRRFDHEKARLNGDDWLEIIDGAGHHSATKGQQRIRPKVKEYLKKNDIKYTEANEGALLITFSEYTGDEPCVANFFCKRCKKTWTSISSWKGFYQRCYRCDANGTQSNCYPFKLRSELPKRRRGPSDFTGGDHRRLCQKCIELGSDCRRQK